MTIFGRTDVMAVEFEIDANSGGSWLFGRFRYWIRGLSIGAYDLGTSLSDVVVVLGSVVKDAGRRQDLRLFELPTNKLADELDAGLYGAVPELNERAMNEEWARFQISLPVDVFDDFRVYLLENGDVARYVIRRLSTGLAVELGTPTGLFDTFARQAYLDLCRLQDGGVSRQDGD